MIRQVCPEMMYQSNRIMWCTIINHNLLILNCCISLGALSLKKCRLLVIDWFWKDKKMRTIADIPEVKDDLNTLLSDIVLPHMQSSKLKLFLY